MAIGWVPMLRLSSVSVGGKVYTSSGVTATLQCRLVSLSRPVDSMRICSALKHVSSAVGQRSECTWRAAMRDEHSDVSQAVNSLAVLMDRGASTAACMLCMCSVACCQRRHTEYADAMLPMPIS